MRVQDLRLYRAYGVGYKGGFGVEGTPGSEGLGFVGLCGFGV